MFGWINKKGQNARIFMCIKELLWDLESSSPLRRAKMVAYSSVYRMAWTEEGVLIYEDVLSRPFDYSRDDLMKIYEEHEDLRNNGALELEQIKKKHMRIHGFDLPAFAIEQSKLTRRALEILMCTIGVGIVPERRAEVRKIWRYLIDSFPQLNEAILSLREQEDKVCKMTGTDERIFPADTNLWLDMCRFVPSSLVKELDL